MASAQKKIRVIQVSQWIMDGKSRQEVLDLSHEAWGVSSGAVDNYRREAQALIEAQLQESAEGMMSFFHQQHMELYSAAREGGELTTALAVLRDWQKLTGAYAPDRTEVTNVAQMAEMPVEDRAKAIQALLDSAQKRLNEKVAEARGAGLEPVPIAEA